MRRKKMKERILCLILALSLVFVQFYTDCVYAQAAGSTVVSGEEAGNSGVLEEQAPGEDGDVSGMPEEEAPGEGGEDSGTPEGEAPGEDGEDSGTPEEEAPGEGGEDSGTPEEEAPGEGGEDSGTPEEEAPGEDGDVSEEPEENAPGEDNEFPETPEDDMPGEDGGDSGTPVDEDITTMDIQDTGLAVRGEISLPEAGVFEAADLKIRLTFYNEQSKTSYVDCVIPEGSTSCDYEAVLPSTFTNTISKLRINVYGDAATNLVKASSSSATSNGAYYMRQNGMTFDASLAESLDISGGIVNVELLKSAISGKIKLPSDGFITSGSYTVYVYANVTKEGSSSSTNYNRSFSLDHERLSVWYSMPFTAEEDMTVNYVRLYVSNNSNAVSNLITGSSQYQYYNPQSDILDTSDRTDISLMAGEMLTADLTLNTANAFLTLKLDESVEFSGASLSGTVYVMFDSGNEKSVNVSIPAGGREAVARFNSVVPLDAAGFSRIAVKWTTNSNLTTNLVLGTKLYFNGTSWGVDTVTYEKPFNDDGLPVEIPVTASSNFLNVRLMFPDGAIHTGGNLTGTLYAYTTASMNYTSKFTIRPEDEYADVTISLPEGIGSLNHIRVYVDNGNGSGNSVMTNVYSGATLYYTGTGLSTASGDKQTNIQVPATGSFLTIPLFTANAVTGQLTIPEDVFIEGKALTGYITINNNSAYRRYFTVSQEDSVIYYAVPLSSASVTAVNRIEYRINANSSTQTNIATNTAFYYAGDNEPLSTTAVTLEYPFSNGLVTKNITVETTKTVSGIITLPEKAYVEGGQATITVYARVGSSNYSRSHIITEDELSSRAVNYSVPVSYTATDLTRVYAQISLSGGASSNLDTRTLYLAADGVSLSASTSDALYTAELLEKNTQVNFVWQLLKNVVINFLLPEGAVLSAGGISIKSQVCCSGRTFTETVVMEEGQTDTSCTMLLTAGYDEFQYGSFMLSAVGGYGSDTNLEMNTRIYFDSIGKFYTDTSTIGRTQITGEELKVDITLPIHKVIRGKVSLPHGMTLSGSVPVSVVISVNGSVYSDEVSLSQWNQEGAYEISLPAGAESIEYLGVSVPESASYNTDLLTGIYYYSSTLQGLGVPLLQATAVGTASAETVIDLVLLKAVSFDGSISLAQDSSFSGAPLSGYIRAYVGDVSYIDYFELSAGQVSTGFDIRLPHDAEVISRVQIKIYGNSMLDTDLLLNTDVYLTESGWSSNIDNAAAIEIEGDRVTKNLEFPKADNIMGTISLPDGMSGICKGTVTVISNAIEYRTDFEIDGESAAYRVSLPPEENQTYKFYYTISDSPSPALVEGDVYVDMDGKNHLTEDKCGETPLLYGTNRRDITLVQWESLSGEAILSSPHPYSNNESYVMSYTYPGSADSLRIHFSEYTRVEQTFDEIIISDTDRKVIGVYTGTELSDADIEIPGNGFSVEINTDANYVNYGFDIDSIEAVNGVPDSEVAVSVASVNDVPSVMVVHNSMGDGKLFYTTMANYDGNGRIIGLETRKLTMNSGVGSMNMSVNTISGSDYAKLMLYDENFVPLSSYQYREVPKHLVTYHFQDEAGAARVVFLAKGAQIEEPAASPSRNGYEFTGWYADAACSQTYEFGQNISESVDIYAGWRKMRSLNIDTEGQGRLSTDDVSGTHMAVGRTVTVTAVPEHGWRLGAWKAAGLTEKTEAGNSLMFTMPDADVSVVAVFERSMGITWTGTGVTAENEDGEIVNVGFEDNYLYLPDGVKTVELTGKMDTPDPSAVTASYTYHHYTKNDEGEEEEISDTDSITIEDDGSFILGEMEAGYGNNVLTIHISQADETYTYDYYIVGDYSRLQFNEEVEMMDLESLTDMMKIDDLATGIRAVWIYDSETPEDESDDMKVLIINKESEIAQRLMLPEENENALAVGDIMVIPVCEQFPMGFTFMIKDVGDAQYAPSAPEESEYYGQAFPSSEYLFILAADPAIADILDDGFSFNVDGVNGVTFALLPDNAVMDASIEGDGMVETASVGGYRKERSGIQPGWQMQNILTNIIPTVSFDGKEATVKIGIKDALLYDKDGDTDTKWDEIKLSGEIGVENVTVDGVFEYHPFKYADVLPKQVGVVAQFTEKRNLKLEIGGTIKETDLGKTDGITDPDEKDLVKNTLKLKEVVKDYKKGVAGDSNAAKISRLTLSGVDMDNTIVLAAVGLSLSGVVGTGYKTISAESKALGLTPIVVIMFCVDFDGNISAKLAFTYDYSCYHAKGLNIQKSDFKGVNSTIAALPKEQTKYFGDYRAEIISVDQSSKTNKAKPYGTYTVSVSGEADIEVDASIGAAFMMSGINFGQVKAGMYAEAGTSAYGSWSYNKASGQKLEGSLTLEGGLGLFWQAMANLKVTYEKIIKSKKDESKNSKDLLDISFGTEKYKYELLGFHFTTKSLYGTVTEPGMKPSEADAPVSGVKVTMKRKYYDSPGGDVQTSVTDEKGKYSFKNVAEGTYDLTFEKDGYATVTEEDVSVGNKNVQKDVLITSKSYAAVHGFALGGDEKPLDTPVYLTLSRIGTKDVKVYNATASVDGSYTLGAADSETEGILPGKYMLTARSKGYKNAAMAVSVPSSGGTVEVENINLVKGIYGDATIKGRILDLADGQPTGAQLTLQLRRNLNNTTGEILDIMKIDTDGAYSFSVPAGNYTINILDNRKGISDNERYITQSFTVSVEAGQTKVKDAYVSTADSSDQIRIVLRWGAKPRDLDSHLLGPTATGNGRFHTYYANKGYSYNGKKYADLDLDDTTSYGPETTTIYKKAGNGVYSFYVHDYSTGQSSTSTIMANSGANVEVYMGASQVAKYYVPASPGTLWHVFDLDAATGTLTPYVTVTGDSYRVLSKTDDDSDLSDEEIIMGSLVGKEQEK